MNHQLTFPVSFSTKWSAADDLSIADPYLKNWLLNTGSLTERLQSHCVDFELALIGQRQMQPDLEELAQFSGAKSALHDSFWQVREVILIGNGQPWVFARSVLPQQLCDMDFAELGNKPLGQIIFNDERFVRRPFQLSCLSESHSLLNTLGICKQRTLWGRRSVFDFKQLQLMVAEIFLPDCPAYSKQG
ncbi:chorismate--pyruvate lyase family protein [Aliiglaciecola lipolytica]|nr:chorismate lyase [Aliiglaciecola lipolytica]